MFGAFPVTLLHHRFMKTGLDNRRSQIVDDQAFGHTTKPLEGMAMEQQPRRQFLVKDKFDVDVPAPGERHDECPRSAHLLRLRVVH